MINKITTQEWVKNKELAKLRVMVKGGGCSGFEYNFSVDDKPTADDDMYETNFATHSP